MSKSSELNSYIVQLQKRLRLGAWLRGAAIFTGTALMVTLALVLVLNHMAFPERGITLARLTILAALAAVAAMGIALPVLRLTRARTVSDAEAANPELEQRLTTFQERAKEGDPFLELLAADTLERTQYAAPSTMVPDNRLFALGGAGLGCLAVLVWMIAAAPGYVGYGASLVWLGPKKNVAPLYSIVVKPGNVTARRNSDQLIVARVKGMVPNKAQLFAKFKSAAGWEPVTMQPAPEAGDGATYQFTFAGLPEDVEYYVAAGPLISQHYKVRVVDLPGVKSVQVTYHYPKWTGMKPVTEEHSGDLRAIEGTDAEVKLQMDRPMKDGQLTMTDGKTIHLKGGPGNVYQGTIHMEKDGAYHVAATDEGQPVRLSEDYFIATDKAQPPDIAIARPNGDYRASPIEEVTVGVKAGDQFGLKDMHLHYSVNGGPDHDMDLLKTPGAKSADGKYMLSLEDLKLVPGDVISLYATAKDGNSQGHTDIEFIQVDPFEREFSQSQQAGGGGGGGGGGGASQTEMSMRQKELIGATWKQQNDKTATAKDNAAQAQFLSDAQQKLRDQVNALSVRMESRDVAEANQEFTDFDKDMQIAASAMGPSADKLKSMAWKDAMPLEQKALQALLRAEATFRKIEVAFGQRGGGGGGGGAGRDLASLFDLELDTEKNQYETAPTASPQEEKEKKVADALEKLDALARRQADLANQSQNPQQSFQDRWQQEMLRREAEQLQRQMEQLARNAAQSQQDQQSASGSSSQQQNGQQQNGQQGGQQQSGQQQNGQQQSGQQGGRQSASQQSGSQGQQGGQQQSASGSSSSGQGSSGQQSASGSSSSGQGSAGQQSAGMQGGQQSGGQPSMGQQNGRQQSMGQQNGAQGQNGARQGRGQSGRQSASSGGGESNEDRIEQSLRRLEQATDAMKRGGTPQQNAEAAREAAEQLQEAKNLLAGSQKQLATGRMGSMTQEAERLAQEEREQAAQINKLANSGQDERVNPNDLDALMGRRRQREEQAGQLAAERQQLSDSLSKLQQNMRDAAREMAPDQPGVAEKLRDALSEMDESDLDNFVQRTADWLRSGINPNSNGTEGQIAQGLQKLSQELQQAENAMDNAKPGQQGAGQQGSESAALNQVERLRDQLEAMARGQGSNNGRPGQNGQNRNGQLSQNGQFRNGQNGEQPGNQGQLSRNGGQPGQNGQNGQQQGQNGQNGQQQGWAMNPQPLGRSGQGSNQGARQGTNQGGNQGLNQGGNQASNQGPNQSGGAGAGGNLGNWQRGGARGDVRNGMSGDTRWGGGGADGTLYDNFDTGNNTPRARGPRQGVPTNSAGNPADTEQIIDQGMRELNQLRQMVQDDPQAAKQVEDMEKQMQRLDPSRFPGNPEMVEQMNKELLGSVDKLELQLQHDSAQTDARTGKPYTVPSGYQESVADYYRRLSKNP